MHLHGKFGLRYNRPTTRVPVRIVDSTETDEDFAARQKEAGKEHVVNRRLNNISKRVREEIDTRLWAAMYLQYLTGRIYVTDLVRIRLSDLPDLQNLSLSDEGLSLSPSGEHVEQPFEHLAVELQIQILEQRLGDACIGTEALWTTLNQLICQLTSGNDLSSLGRVPNNHDADISEQPPDSCIAFRAFNDHSQARYFVKGDIRCGRWQEFNFNEPPTRVGARKHIEGAHIPTNYISISTSPRRIWNFLDGTTPTDMRIAVIDLRVLDRLGIAYGSTTDDLGFGNINGNRTEYATKHHVLVMGWIPSRSILGLLSTQSFKELLQESRFDISGATGRSI